MHHFLVYCFDFPIQNLFPSLTQTDTTLCPLLQLIVAQQSQYVSKNFLALRGQLFGELIGTPLEEVGTIGEGIVVHTQNLNDLLFGLSNGVSRYRPEPLASGYLKVKKGMPRSAHTWPGPLADDPISFLLKSELELHLHLRPSQVNQLIVGLCPCFSPQRPCYSIEER